MKSYMKIPLIFGVVSYFLACSPVKFEKVQAPACNGSGVSCNPGVRSGTEDYVDTKTVGNGLIDILFVNDNSGSMSFEQNHMGSKFPTFISSLAGTDYRIGMITTDVSSNVSSTRNNPPAAPNGNGKFQDGALLEFSSGMKFLSSGTSNAAGLFNNTVRRNETIQCENSGYATASCPSGDERGIFAANLAIDRNDGGFLRPSAPLAIVILADEDVRSGLYTGGSKNPSGSVTNFELQNYDQPNTLISRFRAKFANKPLSVHAIVVKNGDSACLNTQASQGGSNPYVSGSYGRKYTELANLTNGVVGSICSNDYGQELGKIAAKIQDQVTSMAFVCRPLDDDFNVTFTPALPNAVNAVADFDRLVVEFKDGSGNSAELPAGTKVTLSYTCNVAAN